MKLTVGMPVYNGERFLRDALDSILNQTYRDFELIISDNASTDATEAICRSYAENDRRITYLRGDVNRGAAWNFNHLVGVAHGSLFKWAAADDLHEPEHLARCVAALERDPDAVAAYTKSVFIDEAGTRIREYDPGWDLPSDSPVERLTTVILKGGHWVNADVLLGVMRTDALRRTRLFPRYQGGDKRPIGELALQGKIIQIPEHMLLRRHHEGASNTNNPHASQYDAKSVAWMAEFFKGSGWGIKLPSWTLLADHSMTVWTSRLPVRDKLRLSVAVMRAGRWQLPFLWGELKAVGRFMLTNPRR